MEKKEMSFIEKFAAAGKELEKEIKDVAAMILIAFGGEGENSYINVLGESRRLATILSFTALKSNGFEEILRNSIKVVEIYRDKHNK